MSIDKTFCHLLSFFLVGGVPAQHRNEVEARKSLLVPNGTDINGLINALVNQGHLPISDKKETIFGNAVANFSHCFSSCSSLPS